MRDFIKKTMSLMSFMMLGIRCPEIIVVCDGVECTVKCNNPNKVYSAALDHQVISIRNEAHFEEYSKVGLDLIECSLKTKPTKMLMFRLNRDGKPIELSEITQIMKDQESQSREAECDKDQTEFNSEPGWDLIPDDKWLLASVDSIDTADDSPKAFTKPEKNLPKFEIQWVKRICCMIGKEYPDTNVCVVAIQNDQTMIRLLADASFIKAHNKFKTMATGIDLQKLDRMPVIKVEVFSPTGCCKVYKDDDGNQWLVINYIDYYDDDRCTELKLQIIKRPNVLRLIHDGEKSHIFDYTDITSILKIASIAEKNTAAVVAAHGEEMLDKKPEDIPLMFTLHSGDEEIQIEKLPKLLERDVAPLRYFGKIKDISKEIEDPILNPVEIELKWKI